MTKLTTCLVVLFMFLGAGYAGAREVITVRVAEFSPNYFKDDAGNWTGLSVELAEAIIKTAGYEPKFLELPWSRAMHYIENTGELQYMTNLHETDERSEFLHWIGPIRTDKMVLIVHRDNKSFPITSLDDMVTVCKKENRRFGLQKDISSTDAFTQRLNDDPEFRECFETVFDVNQNILKTEHKRILGFFENVTMMRYRVQTDPAYASLAVHSFVLKSGEMFHGLSKKGVSPEMLMKLQAGYAQCVENGTIQRILKKWNAQQ